MVLLGLTTSKRSNWQQKIREASYYNIEKISLFPTYSRISERKKLYEAIDGSTIVEIPHVHLCHDIELWELDYFVKEYNTQIFNIHTERLFPLENDISKYNSKIFVENAGLPTENELKKFGGFCIDFAHWEDYIRLEGEKYNPEEDKIRDWMKKYDVGCGHVSAISEEIHEDEGIPGRMCYASHWMNSLDDIKYMKKYVKYVSKYVSIELDNPFKEQLKVKKYLEKILYKRIN